MEVSELRRVEKIVRGEWVPIAFSELKIGDVFRMFDPIDVPVIGGKGQTTFIASSNPYLNELGVLTVKIQVG